MINYLNILLHPKITSKQFAFYLILLLLNLQAKAQEIEEFKWDLKVGVIKFGDASMVFYNDKSTGIKHINAKANGTGIFQMIYKNTYRFNAEVDPKTGLPIRSSYALSEGHISDFNHITYDHEILPDSTLVISKLTGEKHIHKYSYELLSAFEYFRHKLITPNLKSGDSITVKTYFTDDPWDLIFVYRGKEKIKTELGEKECYVFKPIPIIGDFFHNEDDVTLWITADNWLIPVKMFARLNIAGVTAWLTEYNNPAF